jgi:nucleotide-binding universal stress UspA family protein
MFHHILVPVDFTDRNLPAVEIAIEQAQRSGARLTLLHVIEELELLTDEDSKSFYRRLENQAKTRMREFVKKIPSEGVEMQHRLVYGRRAQMIVHSAEEMEADLIILSSHRIDPENAQGWGTISYRVALLSSCPVLLVK